MLTVSEAQKAKMAQRTTPPYLKWSTNQEPERPRCNGLSVGWWCLLLGAWFEAKKSTHNCGSWWLVVVTWFAWLSLDLQVVGSIHATASLLKKDGHFKLFFPTAHWGNLTCAESSLEREATGTINNLFDPNQRRSFFIFWCELTIRKGIKLDNKIRTQLAELTVKRRYSVRWKGMGI